jgi:hypothetical protein
MQRIGVIVDVGGRTPGDGTSNLILKQAEIDRLKIKSARLIWPLLMRLLECYLGNPPPMA